MTVTQDPDSRIDRRWLAAARVLMALIGLQLLAGATYFTFFAAPEDGGVVTAFDWFVALWALGAALALLAAALLPLASPRRRVEVAGWAIGVHVVWALIKVIAYDEFPVSVIVLALDLLLILLVWQAARRRVV